MLFWSNPSPPPVYPGTDAAQGNRPYQSVYPSIPDVRWPTEAAPPSPLRLPSLQEFEKGVKDLIKFHGHSTSSPPPSLTPPSSQASPISHFDVFSRSPLNSSPSSSRDHHFYTQQAFSSSPMPSPLVYTSSMDSSLAKFSGYPSPPPDDARHINKKYTTEEGDFIIYALHDKKQKWATITRGFAMQFGNMPDRTTSGLQAWYYRMNLRIPVWDKNGWLVFDNDDDEEPRTVTIKCRHKASEGLGLAQRYPERMVEYDWVDEASKLEAQDWGELQPTSLVYHRSDLKRNETLT